MYNHRWLHGSVFACLCLISATVSAGTPKALDALIPFGEKMQRAFARFRAGKTPAATFAPWLVGAPSDDVDDLDDSADPSGKNLRVELRDAGAKKIAWIGMELELIFLSRGKRARCFPVCCEDYSSSPTMWKQGAFSMVYSPVFGSRRETVSTCQFSSSSFIASPR